MVQIWISILIVFWLIIACMGSIFDFEVLNSKGEVVKLSTYEQSKAILIVNVASKCGYARKHYKELVSMYDELHGDGLEILAFPCNQFGLQEPGTDKEIQEFTDSYAVTFPVFAKIEVNGKNTHPLYKYLKSKTGQTEINWNFNKVLVVKGVPIARYPATTTPSQIENDIKKALYGESEMRREL